MSAVKERLREDVDALVGESIDAVSTDELGADLIDIRRAVDRLEAEFVRRLHRFDRAGGSLADGVGTVSWLRAGCGMTAKASVGHATRTIPAPLRTALVLRDQGCRFPGCDRPPAWTDAHHIIHWANGGPTEIENLVSLCRRHHRRVHEEGWRIRVAEGSAVFEPPP